MQKTSKDHEKKQKKHFHGGKKVSHMFLLAFEPVKTCVDDAKFTFVQKGLCLFHVFPGVVASIHPSINQSIDQSINQSINPSINQSIDQSINQPINQSINQSVSQSVNQSINQSINQSNSWSFRKPHFHQVKLDRGTIAPELSRYIVEHPCQTTGNPRGELLSTLFFGKKSAPNIF